MFQFRLGTGVVGPAKTLGKWAGDKHAAFDELHAWLRTLAPPTTNNFATLFAGLYDPDWRPAGIRFDVLENEFTGIAGLSGNDEKTQAEVSRILRQAGIEHYMEGSVIYGVSVIKAQARRATKLLKDHFRDKPNWIRF